MKTNVALLAAMIGVVIAIPTSAADAAECRVHGAHVKLEQVLVRPKGAEPFELDLDEAEVTARIPTWSGAATPLRVTGPISFEASRAHLWLNITTDFTSADGMVRLRKGAQLVNARVEGGAVVAAAVLDVDDMLEGEDKPADEWVSPVRVPCSILRLGFGDGESDENAEEVELPEDGEATGDRNELSGDKRSWIWWRPKRDGTRLRLFSSPSDDARFVDVRWPSCENCLTVLQVEERGSWLRVQESNAFAGVTVTGWIRRSLLEVEPNGGGRGGGCSGDHRSYLGGERHRIEPLYEGPAIVRAGTRVFAEPPLGEWAKFERSAEVLVRHFPNSVWVELRDVPGIAVPAWALSRFASVPYEAVTFPVVSPASSVSSVPAALTP